MNFLVSSLDEDDLFRHLIKHAMDIWGFVGAGCLALAVNCIFKMGIIMLVVSLI